MNITNFSQIQKKDLLSQIDFEKSMEMIKAARIAELHYLLLTIQCIFRVIINYKKDSTSGILFNAFYFIILQKNPLGEGE